MWLGLVWMVHAAEPPAPEAAYGEVLKAAVASGRVDYDAVMAHRATLQAALDGMAATDVSGWTEPQRLALYINAYNACTLAIVADARVAAGGTLDSIRSLDGGKVWDTRTCTVAGEALTLNRIEHERVRPLGDARIHAALVCAAAGCPPLSDTPVVAGRVDAQLTAASKAWVASTAVGFTDNGPAFSEIFKWYTEDFADLAASDATGLSVEHQRALGFVRAHAQGGRSERLAGAVSTASWAPYDWSLNDR